MESEPGRSPALCPSAQPDMAGAIVIGVVVGTPQAPRARPLQHPLAVTPELLALAEPATPTEVFRFAAPCLESGCRHFAENTCHLAENVVRLVPSVGGALPACDIRRRCRWFAQEGREACRRCPQIVPDDAHPQEALRVAAMPARSQAAP